MIHFSTRRFFRIQNISRDGLSDMICSGFNSGCNPKRPGRISGCLKEAGKRNPMLGDCQNLKIMQYSKNMKPCVLVSLKRVLGCREAATVAHEGCIEEPHALQTLHCRTRFGHTRHQKTHLHDCEHFRLQDAFEIESWDPFRLSAFFIVLLCRFSNSQSSM